MLLYEGTFVPFPHMAKKQTPSPSLHSRDAPEQFRIEYVTLENGATPFQAFLDDLGVQERAEVLAMMEEFRLLRSQTPHIPESVSKALANGIFELRVRHSSRITRGLYFYMKGKRIIFTHGFVKKTRTTPQTEIKKAERYRTIHLQKEQHESK
jgi:phage-related protein